MFVRVKRNPKSSTTSILVCHNKRIGNKVKQFVIKNYGSSNNKQSIKIMYNEAKAWVDKFDNNYKNIIKLSCKNKEPTMSSPQILHHLKSYGTINISSQEIIQKIYKEAGLNNLFSESDTEVLLKSICARLYSPSSKRKTSYILRKKFNSNISPDKIYRLLDKLILKEKEIHKKIFNKTKKESGDKIDLMFFDVTTLSFETNSEDEIRACGFSKDGKSHHVQVVLALATTSEGLPIGYQLFPGNTAEVKTLISSIESWKKNVSLNEVTVVADRAMLSQQNLKTLEQYNIKYVVACPLRKLPQNLKNQVLDDAGYSLKDCCSAISWIKEINLENNRRLITTYNRSRHCKDKKDRERTIEKLLKKLGKSKNMRKLISSNHALKYIDIEGLSKCTINQEKIGIESKWDGLQGVITNSNLNALEIISRYKNLWVIEESFRINKHNLEIRPIYHYKPERIKAHILLCFITYSLLRFLQNKLKKSGVQYTIENLLEHINDIEATVIHDSLTDEFFGVLSINTPEINSIYSILGINTGGTLVSDRYYEQFKEEEEEDEFSYLGEFIT